MSLRHPVIAAFVFVLSLLGVRPTEAGAQLPLTLQSILGIGWRSPDGDYPTTEPGLVRILIANNTSTVQTIRGAYDCGSLTASESFDVNQDGNTGECPNYLLNDPIAANGTLELDLPVRLWSGAESDITLQIWPASSTSQITLLVFHVKWSTVTNTVTVTLKSSYSAALSPHTANVTVPGHSAQTQTFTLTNAGTVSGSYTISKTCTWTCTVSASTVTLGAGQSQQITVSYTAGFPGTGAVIQLRAVGQALQAGTYPQDSASVAITPTDIQAPSLTLDPGPPTGTTTYTVVTRSLSLAVTACDAENGATVPTLTLNGTSVIPATVVDTGTTCAATSWGKERATFGLTLNPGANTVVSSTNDGPHTTTKTITYYYDDGPEHRAVVTPLHTTRSVELGRPTVDTFTVRNPGPLTAQYTLSATCTNPSGLFCGGSVSTSSITLASGATTSVVVGYEPPYYVNEPMAVTLTATYVAQGGSTTSASATSTAIAATTAAFEPTRITFTGPDSTVRSSPTFTLKIDWCDPDDVIQQTTVWWRGQQLSDAFVEAPWGSRMPDCKDAGRTTYTGLTMPVGSGYAVAQAVDNAGHVRRDSVLITYLAPPTDFQPRVIAPTSVPVAPRGTEVRVPFVVTNVGVSTATYQFAGTCGWACSPDRLSATLAPGDVFNVGILIDPPANGTTASVGLIAKRTDALSRVIADTGRVTMTAVSFASLAQPAVTPVDQGAVSIPYNTVRLYTFTVQNSGSIAASYTLDTYGFGGNWPLVEFASGVSPSNPLITLASGETRTVVVRAKSPANTTWNIPRLHLHAAITNAPDGSTADADSYVELTLTGSPTRAVTVSSASSVAAARGATRTVDFTITNNGPDPDQFVYAATCEQPLVCTSPTGSQTTATLDPAANASATVTVTLQTPNDVDIAGKRITLNVHGVTYPSTTGGTFVSVTTGSTVGSVTIVASNLTGGPAILRDQCVTLPAGLGAAYECGDLRLAHALPTTTTFNTAHTPVLTYNSRHQTGTVLIPVDVSITDNVVTSITATVTFDGKAPQPQVFSWDPNSGPKMRRINVPVDARGLSLGTGYYHYTVEVAAHAGTQAYDPVSAGANIAIVNRTGSLFGPGWWLDGLEQLVPVTGASNQMLWAAGDGSTRVYTQLHDSVWTVASLLDRPDTLRYRASENQWYRLVPGGDSIVFNAYGQEIAASNVRGQRTSFTYNSALPGDLATITLPVPVGAPLRSYTFVHDGTTSLVTRVDAPPGPGGAARQTQVVDTTLASGDLRVVRLKDPDTASVSFGFDAWGRLTSRIDRVGTTTSFAYDGVGNGLASATVHMGVGATDIVQTFCATETASLTPLCAPGPIARDSLWTIYDGPRSDADVTRFVVNRFGAADVVIDALGNKTTIERDQTFPVLPGIATAANGFRTKLVYNNRALVTTDTAFNIDGAGANAITTYEWHGKWPLPTTVTSPAGIQTNAQYDDTYGDLQWQQVGSNTARRTTFEYYASGNGAGLVRKITPPSPLDSTRIFYDGLGNDSATVNPRGVGSITLRDGLGRPSLITTPIDTDGVYRRVQAFQYDALDRVRIAVDSAPEYQGATTWQWVQLSTRYDKEGRSVSVTRHVGPSASTANDIVDSVVYDPTGRIKQRIDPHRNNLVLASWAYSSDGTSVTKTTPNSTGVGTDVVYFDVLNRPSQREISDVPGISGSGDSQTFTYDELTGNLKFAGNRYARVGRTYFPNGLLKTDTLHIGAANLSSDPNFTMHVYVNEYTYDRDGNRLTHKRPANVGLFAGTTTYDYDSQTGSLTHVNDTQIGTFAYVADFTGALESLTRPDGTADRFTYRTNGLPIGRTDGTALAPAGMHSDAFRFDGRGKNILTTTSTLGSSATTPAFGYAGLGGVLGSPTEDYTRDPLGSTLTRHVTTAIGGTFTHYYEPNSTRLSNILGDEGPNTGDTIVVQYDDAGKVKLRQRRVGFDQPCPPPQLTCDLDHATALSTLTNDYTGDGRLRFSNYQTSNDGSGGIDTTKTAPFAAMGRGADEEYRYDALGRRVWRRAKRDVYCSDTDVSANPICLSVIERTVYDGDQVLAEIRQPGGASEDPSVLESDAALAAGTAGSFPTQFGVASYLNGVGIDQPLAVARLRSFSGTSTTQRVILHRNWEGAVDFATLANGQPIDCGRLNAVSACEHIPWPGLDMTIGFRRPTTDVGQFTWWGTMVAGNLNATGLIDLRARQFDPLTGVFLQEDPIGMSGGLNTYGFGGGDAVNFRDPDGTCPSGFIANPDSRGNGKTWCVPPAVLDPVVVTAPSPFFESMRALQGILDGVGELSGINGFGRGAEQMQGGSIARGALTMLLASPVLPEAAPGRIFSANVLVKMARTGDKFHNFPSLIGEQVLKFGQRTRISGSYAQYTLSGAVNGVEGIFEIGVRPSPGGNFETITHWLFRPY